MNYPVVLTKDFTISTAKAKMVNSEKLCLQWNEFPKIVRSAFEDLRDDLDLTDVTLVCNDGKQVEAHKVVLASTSPFFMELLKRNRHPHPLIYMRGIKSEDLMAMVEFLYKGEAFFVQENLETFLALVEKKNYLPDGPTTVPPEERNIRIFKSCWQ